MSSVTLSTRSHTRHHIEEQRFRQVVDHVRDVVFETDADGCLTFLNPAWTETTGFEIEDALTRPMLDFIHPDDAALYLARYKPLLDGTADVARYQARYCTRDGAHRWIETNARVVPAGRNRRRMTIGTLRDVTRQREMADEITRAHKQALGASVLMSEFLANMSHEVRTPLNGVVGLATLLLDTSLDTEQRAFVVGIQESADALLTIVNDILDLSKIEADRLVIEQIAFDLRSTVTQALAPLDVRAARKGLRLDLCVGSGVPQRIVADPGRLRQLLVNLVDNAVKFTASGRIAVCADVWLSGPAVPMLRFEVQDTGIGIPRDKQALVFEKFKQADSSVTRHYGGTGLGLAICRQLVTLMEGEIGLDSAEGAGSTFWFTIPLRADEAAAEALQPVDTRPAASGLQPARVLLVEDNVTNQTVARLFLEKLSCAVELAANGAEAVMATRQRRFDVIFMDCQMPVLDGYTATQQIRQQSCCTDVPIVAMTAHAMAGDRERCLAAGMTDYLSKPLKRELMAAALARARSGARPAAAADPVPPSPADACVFDAAGTLQVLDGDVEAVVAVVGTLAADLPRYAADAERALADQQWPQLRRAAHTIAGAASNVSAGPVCDTARRIEELLRAGDSAGAAALVPGLHAATACLVTALTAWARTLTEERSHARSGMR